MNELTLSEIQVCDYVECGFVSIVVAVVKSMDGMTYIQVISPKAAAHGHANNCDWVPFLGGALRRATRSDFEAAVKLYSGVIERRNLRLLDEMKRVEFWQK